MGIDPVQVCTNTGKVASPTFNKEEVSTVKTIVILQDLLYLVRMLEIAKKATGAPDKEGTIRYYGETLSQEKYPKAYDAYVAVHNMDPERSATNKIKDTIIVLIRKLSKKTAKAVGFDLKAPDFTVLNSDSIAALKPANKNEAALLKDLSKLVKMLEIARTATGDDKTEETMAYYGKRLSGVEDDIEGTFDVYKGIHLQKPERSATLKVRMTLLAVWDKLGAETKKSIGTISDPVKDLNEANILAALAKLCAPPSVAKPSGNILSVIPKTLSADGEPQNIVIKLSKLDSTLIKSLDLIAADGSVAASVPLKFDQIEVDKSTGEVTIGSRKINDPLAVRINVPKDKKAGTYTLVLKDEKGQVLASKDIEVINLSLVAEAPKKLPAWVKSLRGQSALTLQVGNPANEGRDGIAKDDNYARGNFEKPLVGLSAKWAPELRLWDGALNVTPDAHGSFSYFLNYRDADGTRRANLGLGAAFSTDKLRSYWGLDPQLSLAYGGAWYHENFRSPNQPVKSEGIFDLRLSVPFAPGNLTWLTLSPILAAQVRHSAYATEITGSSFDAIRTSLETGAWAKFALSKIWNKPGVPDLTLGGSGLTGKRDVPDSLIGSWERKIGGYHLFGGLDFSSTPWHPSLEMTFNHLEDGTRTTKHFFVTAGMEPPATGKFKFAFGKTNAFALSPLVTLEGNAPFLLDTFYTAGYDDSTVPFFLRVKWDLPVWQKWTKGFSVLGQYERQEARGQTRNQFSGYAAYDFMPLISE